ncbi:sensor histidine kinase [Natribacillus halophilus]|uniref:histidine kinase n=1 Tax=Natribacillus halophilus TaxID=549003 RepID=A0A1G8S243_9BACI|nr:histidine kinase [Natribacillus halophilus]SDJ23289.1 Signal transduction histidine kinase [Natribacillus halophilus]
MRERFVNIWRFMNILFLLSLWTIQDESIVSFLFIVALTILVCLRWRFQLPTWTVLIDIVICALFMPFWSVGVFGFALPLFESITRGKYAYIIPIVILIPIGDVYSVLLFWFLFQAGFLGVLVRLWKKQRDLYISEADSERRARYELENMRNELLRANRQTAQLAELSERNRIARDLHDHVGHDLTGASLAMDTFEHLEGKEADAMLQEIKLRITRSAARLRDTVHDMIPVTRMGADVLEHIADEFNHTAVSFQKSGDMNEVPVHYWSLLEPCLKEALTNVARHSDATRVDIQLDITATIVRMSVQDNGTDSADSSEGRGLRNLKLRARAAGGSLSVDTASGHLIVCVLPLQKEEEMR